MKMIRIETDSPPTIDGLSQVASTAWDGSNWTATDTAPSQSAVQGALAAVSAYWGYSVSSGTEGGTATAGSWFLRGLNAERYNSISGAALDTNVITLPAGTYSISGWASAYDCNRHRTKIYDDTHGIDLIYGRNIVNSQNYYAGIPSQVDGVWHFPVQTSISLYHRVETTKSDTGRGTAAGFGIEEIYAGLSVSKIIITTAVLTTAVDPSGTISPAAGAYNVPVGVRFSIKGTPAGGKQFSEWTVTGGASVASSSTNPTTAKLTATGTITAVFVDVP